MVETCSSSMLSLPACFSVTTNKTSWKRPTVSFFSITPISGTSTIRCCYYTNKSRTNKWDDSNAENSRYKQAFEFGDEPPKRKSWWSDEDYDYDDSDDFGRGAGTGGGGGLMEEAIDTIWIFKVFRTYGWMLPIIIISMLLATGPKAFLMALALPLGQSAVFFAIDKVFGRTPDRPKRRARTKRKPFARAANYVDEEEEDADVISGRNEPRQGYQSWVATADTDSVKKGVDQCMGSFGGWEELDKRQEFDKERERKKKSRQSVGKGKLSRRRGRQRETPLLLRLLIAVFPFLGSWTRLL